MKSGRRVLRWLGSMAAAMVVAFFAARARGLRAGMPFALTVRYLSDGFFVSAVLVGGLGLLIRISTSGFFDIFSYGFSSLVTLFTSLRHPKDQPSYLDYKNFREEHRQPARRELLAAGLLCALLSIICWGMWQIRGAA